ncbi:MAG: hypothetical protein KJ792_04195 [Actinobacteria bacterium]|nr:hypothetical protein [Actinomycetota bacterium]
MSDTTDTVDVSGTWCADLDYLRDRWADAPLSDHVLATALLAAHEQLAVYAPALADGAPIPERYKQAEVLQVRGLWQAQERDGDVIGYGDGYAVRVRPLSQDVKSLLRPKRGVPVVR